ncbi:MAG: lysophospholipid acyltransferase family protein [Polyangiaceae bacterium]
MTMARAAGLAGALTRLVVEAETKPPVTTPDYAARAARTAQTLLQVHGVDVTWRGSRPTEPSIVVANHLSYIDPLAVASVLPCIAIAKGETRSWPLIGRGLQALGVIFVQRGDARSGARALRAAWRAIRAGSHVLNFPEGTTTDGSLVGPFRRGIFGLAVLAGIPVVPARVSYDDPRVPWFGGQTFAPHYWRLSGVTRVGALVVFGEAMHAGPACSAVELARRAREAVAAL